MATSEFFLHNVVIWAHFPLYHLHLSLFSLAKMWKFAQKQSHTLYRLEWYLGEGDPKFAFFFLTWFFFQSPMKKVFHLKNSPNSPYFNENPPYFYNRFEYVYRKILIFFSLSYLDYSQSRLHFLLGALDFVDITKLEKKKIMYRWLFFAANFVFKKQARKTVFFSNCEWFLKQNFIQFCKIKKTERKNTAQCPYLQLPPT
jgi:hypothetical protein